jgi:23S rRNA maturation mini-RNase III
MITHPYATTLMLLVTAERQQRKYADGTFEDAVYEVIERAMLIADYSNERKADLYARIAESVTAEDKLAVLERKIGAALFANDKEFPNG